VKKIFDPVVDRIEQLVKEQVQSVQRKGEHVAVSCCGPLLDIHPLREFSAFSKATGH
jgi:hypothetical protein